MEVNVAAGDTGGVGGDVAGGAGPVRPQTNPPHVVPPNESIDTDNEKATEETGTEVAVKSIFSHYGRNGGLGTTGAGTAAAAAAAAVGGPMNTLRIRAGHNQNHRSRYQRALCCLDRYHPIRRFCLAVASSPYFTNFILFVILLNCGVLVLQSGNITPNNVDTS